MKQLIVILIILFSSTSILFAQDTLRVFFVGNSYTNSNSLRNIVGDIAASQGNVLIANQSTPGGFTFNGHTTNTNTQNGIAEGNWDFVTLQEQSQMPAFSPNQVSNQVYPFATELVNDIRAANPCTEPMFFMTWGRENGDQGNCANYEPLCTYEGMQERLTQSYTEMAVDNKGIVSPVGEAWRRVRESNPEIGLYTGDGSHPNIHGSYLAACVFYSMLYGESIEGDYFVPTNITTENAEILRAKADETVFDADSIWNFSELEVIAAGTHTLEDNLLTCTNTSSFATMITWDFGDGASSTESNPIHTYATSGTFTVVCTVSNECTSDEYSFEVTSIVSNLEDSGIFKNISISPNPFENEIKIETQIEGEIVIDIFDSRGKKVGNIPFINKQVVNLVHLAKGIYFLRVEKAGEVMVRRLVKR